MTALTLSVSLQTTLVVSGRIWGHGLRYNGFTRKPKAAVPPRQRGTAQAEERGQLLKT